MNFQAEMRERTREMRRAGIGRGPVAQKTASVDFDLFDGAHCALASGDTDGSSPAMAAMASRVVEQLVAEYGKAATVEALRNMAEDIEASMRPLPSKEKPT